MSDSIDLQAYFNRIGYTGTPRPDLETLRALQFHHVTTVPFENLDVQMGRRVRLDLPHLEDKMVSQRRGGYCFEQNTLFQQVLKQIGFEVEPFEAQVRVARRNGPRTHMLLHVPLDGRHYIADVGFGNSAPLEPLLLSGVVQKQFGQRYRIVRSGRERVLQLWHKHNWLDLYAFVPDPRLPADFEMGNWYTSTHEDSGFVQALVVQLLTPEERYVLRNLTYQVWRGEGVAEERVIEKTELIPLLRERFGLEVPPDATFRALG
ncbi:MAG: arylamine N-acetyltransferase [Dehalococcoidia bacterium]